jgi:hypothetical protein
VQFRATLAGVAAPLLTEPLEIDLHCAGGATDAGLNFTETGVPDGGALSRRADDASRDREPTQGLTAGGGCRSAPGAPRGSIGYLALMMVWVAARRRLVHPSRSELAVSKQVRAQHRRAPNTGCMPAEET